MLAYDVPLSALLFILWAGVPVQEYITGPTEEETLAYIPSSHFVIADAKRGDIGNTSGKYASAIFDYLKADAVTVAPYMGSDSIIPFYEYPDKWVVILGLTSNPGSKDFQFLTLESGEKLYQKVISEAKNWGNEANTMFVVGATHPNELAEIRKIIPNHFILKII